MGPRAEGTDLQWCCPRERPGLPERRLVQANFGSFVAALSGELVSWQSDHCLRAGLMLFRCLPYMEDNVAHHLHKLLPSLCQVLRGRPPFEQKVGKKSTAQSKGYGK